MIQHKAPGNCGKIRLQTEILSNLSKLRKLGRVLAYVPEKKSPDDTAIMAYLGIINEADSLRDYNMEIIRELLKYG